MSTHNATEMLNAFIEAGSALQELPKVRAELEQSVTANRTLADRVEAAEFHALELDDEISRLRADLAKREVELADVTFRHGEAEKVIASVRSLLPGLAAPTEAPAPTVTQSDDASGEAPTQDNAETREVQGMHGTYEVFPDELVSAMPYLKTPEHIREPATDEAPAPTEDKEPATDPVDLDVTALDVAREYIARNGIYVNKPSFLTWAEWANLGGDVPYWVSDRNVA